MHTSESSRCGRSSAHDMVKAYRDKGFSGVVITDHFVNGYSYAALKDTWKDKIDTYLVGYHAAKEAGDELGIKVYLGWEFTYQRNNGEDYLTLGLSEHDLYENLIDCDQMTIEEYVDKVHALGGIIIRAHPYREAGYIKESGIERPSLPIDAVEVFNAGNEKQEFNDKAFAFAKKHGLHMVAGSDTHHVDTVATGYVGFESDPADYAALCEMIRTGKAQWFRQP